MSSTHDLGKRKPPKTLMPDDDLGEHFDQRRFDETQEKREKGLLAEVQKVAHEHPETRRHLVPLIRKFARR